MSSFSTRRIQPVLRRRVCRRGATAVEFAFVFPILMILVVGMIEFTRVSMIHHAADSAAYEAARLVIVPGAKGAEAIAEATDYLQRVGVVGASIVVTPSVITQDTSQVTVNVSVPLEGNSWLPAQFVRGQQVERQCRLMTERAQGAQSQAI